MKRLLLLLPVLASVACAQDGYVFINAATGYVLDQRGNPVTGARIYVADTLAFNAFKDYKYTDTKGRFFVEGMEAPNYTSYRNHWNDICFRLIVQKGTCVSDTIDLKNYQLNSRRLDTVELNIIKLSCPG